MSFEQYVEEGKQLLVTETQTAERWMELAGGVEKEHGALAKWAQDVGISQKRAENLKKAYVVNQQIDGAVDLPVSTAVELASVPDKQLAKTFEKAKEITAEDRGLPVEEIKAPSQRAARKAAEPFRKKVEPKPLSQGDQEHQTLTTLSEMRTKASGLRDQSVMGFTPSTTDVRDLMLRDVDQIRRALEEFATALVSADIEAVVSHA